MPERSDSNKPPAAAAPYTPAVLLTEIDLAQLLGVKPATLRDWRVDGRGPVFVQLGRRVRYRPADVDRWLDEQTRRSTSDPGPRRRRSA
ncbi:hypothetical protein J421_0043 [Gemmatirosa kalamazoonensis]|uniref:Helix-turn-helix domain-containing protein n=1 Tax=Gemmatirosa kalamazoonensis TaxID=861299 RepID=W0RB88_9BACT|nr:helix-turn-helix domain-containing protein [Gemmatirosa kalamazoonensis]AHG87559.1 hypothetical protein J421_0021 [Gemmatirosa kalamazoonensis]AHG87580.1 hypothetical protein J421_0043 [Gemmatirosa kalamazoonensis]